LPGYVKKPQLPGYGHYFNKFLNPRSKAWNEPATDGIESALKWTSRAALGTGLVAGGAAAAITAAPAAAAAGATAARAAQPVLSAARTVGNAASRAGSAVPEPVRRGATLATGLPFSKSIGVAVGADALQGAGYGYLSGVDQANADAGNPTNWRALTPFPYLTEGVFQAGFGSPETTAAPPGQATQEEPQPGISYNDAAEALEQQDPSGLAAGGDTLAVGTAQQPTAEQHAAAEQSVRAAVAPNAPPEARQQGQQDFKTFMQQQVDAKPEFKAGAADMAAGKNTPAAQAFRQHLKAVGDDVMDAELSRLYAENPNPTPEQAGGMFAQAQQAWNGLSPEAKMMVGLGGSVGLVGLAATLFSGGDGEGGGLLPLLLSILGVGGAALGAASGGMFGDAGTRMYGDVVRNVGGFFGADVPQGNQDLSFLLTGDPLSAAMNPNSTGSNSTSDPASRLKELQRLTSLSADQAAPFLMSIDPNNIKTREQALTAHANAIKLQQRLAGMGVTPERAEYVQNAATNALVAGSKLYNDPINTLTNLYNSYAAPEQPGTEKRNAHMAHGFKDIYTTWVAKQAAVAQFMKAARCWAGYEPVPGKEPYSENSCRPVGSKKKEKTKKKEKKAANSLFPSFEERKQLGASGMAGITGKRPTMKQMPPKKPAPPAPPREPFPATPYVSLGQQAAEAAARARFGEPDMMVKTQAAKMSASSLFHCATKELEPVINGKKPSTENTKHVSVVHRDPAAEDVDLKPEAADMRAAG
jgi:hypothetical protein